MQTATARKLNAKVRSEIINSLNDAISNRIEEGTVVTSNGFFSFTITYKNYTANGVEKLMTKIAVNGNVRYRVNDVASHMLSVWKMTR